MIANRRAASFFAALVLVVPFVAPAAASDETLELAYQTPSDILADVVGTPWTPRTSASPDGEWMLLIKRPGYPSIAELSEEELRLGGLRIAPALNAPSRALPHSGLEFMRISDLSSVAVAGLPGSPRIENVQWSPDGAHVLFTHRAQDGVELWVVERESGGARRLTGPVVSLLAGEAPAWLSNGREIVFAMVPPERGAAPAESRVPAGPVVRENLGRATPARTYQDLLEDAHDEALFEHYMTTQLARVDLDGDATLLGEPGMIWRFDPSPDGEYILVSTLQRPFSYVVPVWRFPERIEIWSRDGVPVREIADLPLRDSTPITYGSVAEGPRSVSWQADAPATLTWVEALDGGDAGVEAEERDRLFMLDAPFEGDPEPLLTLSLRFAGVMWGRDDLAIVVEFWWETRAVRTWRVRPGSPGSGAELIHEYSYEDRYAHPGEPVMRSNEWGRQVLATSEDGESLFLIGEGASPEGERPFYDRFDLASGEAERLFRSAPPCFEEPKGILGGDPHALLVTRESVEERSNYFLRDLERGELRQLTFFPHPWPDLVGIQKEFIEYRRDDGLPLSGMLYLPAAYSVEDGPLPCVMWAYPDEFKSASAAGQVTDSPCKFDWLGWWSPLIWLTQGYAVLDNPSMPIVGEGDEEPNDTYVEQLVSDAAAAIDELVRRGVADPGRVAIGGHSYGAFMVVNLLAHSDLFAAGVARTGAYNRTLTPFGFQAEDRTLWEAPDVYFAMSPFMHADKVDEPLLLIHGEADNNPGTFPMQSERLYNALKGLGATVRLVMLPHESHSYRAMESLLHVTWETERWLDRHVKSAGSEDPE